MNIKADQPNSGSKADMDSGESGKEEGDSEDGKKDRRSTESDNMEQRKRTRTSSLETDDMVLKRKVRIVIYKISN